MATDRIIKPSYPRLETHTLNCTLLVIGNTPVSTVTKGHFVTDVTAVLIIKTFRVFPTSSCRCHMYNFNALKLDAGLLARSQYSEGPATGHLDTGFS